TTVGTGTTEESARLTEGHAGFEHLYFALVALGAGVIILTSVSSIIRRSLLSENLLAIFVGVIIGPDGLELVEPTRWVDVPSALELVAGFVASVALMEVGLRLPIRSLKGFWRVPAVLLGPVTIAMWGVSTALVHFVGGQSLAVAAIIGAAISPTDPVVASAIVSGSLAERLLPERIRHAVSAESGANDGIAYPLMLIPLLLLTRSAGDAAQRWAVNAVLLHVGAGLLLGVVVGYLAGALLARAEDRQTSEAPDLIAYTPGLLIFILGVSRLLPINGFLAVFASGLAFQVALGRTPADTERRSVVAASRIATMLMFVLLGTVLPWQKWPSLGWHGLLLVIAVLLLRRLPALIAVRRLLGHGMSLIDVTFIGWFGPIGIGAVYYAAFAWGRTGNSHIWVVVSLIVTASVLVHGATAAPFSRLYHRHATAQERSG
ncbi:MAG: cation:proton antiporter domain-containing protein, partial [Actinomycetes bacterium]